MGKVITGKVRFSYVALTMPRTDLNGNQKYSVTALLPKTDVQTKAAIDKAIAEAIEEGRKGKWNGLVPPTVPTPIHDGDGVKQDGSPFGPECKGHWVFTASTNADPARPKPDVIDANLQPIMDATQIYSGMFGRLSVNFAPYFSAGKKGIGCYLNHAQKLADGEPLAGTKASASEDFGGGDLPLPNTPPAQPVQQYQTQPANWSANQGVSVRQAVDPITGSPIAGGIMGI